MLIQGEVLSDKLSTAGIGLIVLGVVACLGIVALVIFRLKDATVPPTAQLAMNSATPVYNAPAPAIAVYPATETIPVGEVFDLKVNVSGTITELYNHETQHLPWTSFDMDNNGPDPVYFCVNQWYSPQAPIQPGGTIHVDLKRRGSIKKVFLKCDSGQSSNVSFYIIK